MADDGKRIEVQRSKWTVVCIVASRREGVKKGGGLGEGGSKIGPDGRLADLFFSLSGYLFPPLFLVSFWRVHGGSCGPFGLLFGVILEPFG